MREQVAAMLLVIGCALNSRLSYCWEDIISAPAPMRSFSQAQALIAESVLLDSRLALFHERENWLAVADLHFGFELSQRAAGRLVPFRGMESIETRLRQLVCDYTPGTAIKISCAGAGIRLLDFAGLFAMGGGNRVDRAGAESYLALYAPSNLVGRSRVIGGGSSNPLSASRTDSSGGELDANFNGRAAIVSPSPAERPILLRAHSA